MMRWDIINHLIKKNGYYDYLEIGYYKGWSFDRVECPIKTAVDPNPSKTPEQEAWVYGKGYGTVGEFDRIIPETIFKKTSDEFFEVMTPSSKWGIIFIDGKHESQQALRDVKNAQKHLRPRGTIVIHDCNPLLYGHTTSGIDGCWTGDTYKVSIVLANAYPEFYTIETDWGVGILKNSEDKDLKIEVVTNEHFNKFGFDYFEKNRKELINLITTEEFLEREKILQDGNTVKN